MAAGDITNKRHTSLPGIDMFMCRIVVNGTTPVTIATGYRKIESVQHSFAEAPGTGDDSVLFHTISGGTISIDCNAACGAVEVDVLAFGFRG